MKPAFIHPTAVIDPGARIGNGTHIWHFCHLMPGCVVGEDCNIGMNVFIDNNVQVGRGVKVQNNVSVYNGVLLEDDVFLGPSMVFTNVINPRSFLERKAEFKTTIVRKGATIGANATIVCGVEIGAYAFVGAGSVVVSDIAAYALFVGNPAKQVGWMSEYGQRLEFDMYGNAMCSESGEGYKLTDGKVNKKAPAGSSPGLVNNDL